MAGIGGMLTLRYLLGADDRATDALFGLLIFGAFASSIGVQFLVRARPTR
jgi:hypothetical protein